MNRYSTLSKAWRLMFQERTCPPLNVLKKGGPLVERHLASCDGCRTALANADDFARLGELLKKRIPAPQKPETPPSPGSIRSVVPSIPLEERFDADGRYHVPPLVLVLDAPDDNGFVRVSQVFDEEELADAGDIPLGEGMWAEAWNTYGLHVNGLARTPCLSISDETLSVVLNAADKQYEVEDASSPLYYFRAFEKEHGFFFSWQINSQAIAEQEEAHSIPRMDAPVNERKPKIIPFRKEIVGTFRNTILPDWEKYAESLPMAAAGETGPVLGDGGKVYPRVPCLVCFIKNDETIECMTLPADVRVYEESNECAIFCTVPKKCKLIDKAVESEAVSLSNIDSEIVAGESVITICIYASYSGHDFNPAKSLRTALLLSD